MQAYLNFFDKLDPLIEKASYEKKLELGLDVCKKLFPDYQAYATRNKTGNAPLLWEAIDFCEQSKSQKSDTKKLEGLIENINKIIPDPEDFSSWGISHASNSAEAVHKLLLFLKDADNEHISDICSLLIDTVDFKIAEENEHLSDEGIYKHPMMLAAMKELIEKL